MTEINDKELRKLLKAAIPRINPELRRDLWPAMLDRLRQPVTRFCWYDWALIAALCGWVVMYPQGFLQLLYQL